MPNVYDSQPAKYFALLEGWRQVIIAILELLQDVSCYHIHNYLDLFFGHHGDETTATACESCNSMWPQLETLRTQIDELQPTVPYIRKVFWRNGPPTLSRTSRWLLHHASGSSIEGIRAYHHEVLLGDSYDPLTAYVLACGPEAYERLREEEDEAVNRGERIEFSISKVSSNATGHPGARPLHSDPHLLFMQRRPRGSTAEFIELSWRRHNQPTLIHTTTVLFSPHHFVSFMTIAQLRSFQMERSLTRVVTGHIAQADNDRQNILGVALLNVRLSMRAFSAAEERDGLGWLNINFAILKHHDFRIMIGNEDGVLLRMKAAD